MRVVIIDYGSGNTRSVERALASAAAGQSVDLEVTAEPERIRAADRLVLPGVGHFADCKAGLLAAEGALEAMTEAVRRRGVPFLGVCVGMQLLADVGREDGDTPGLGWIGGAVERLAPADPALRVPHMGWNALAFQRPHPAFAGLAGAPHVYFVHGYAMRLADEADCVATAEYGGRIVAALARDNIIGTQFHPEKSQKTGQILLKSFLDWAP
jgi:glutamine amidotransferase